MKNKLNTIFTLLFLLLSADIVNCQIVISNKLVEKSHKFNIYLMANSDSSVWLVTDKGLIRYQNDSLNYYFIDTNDNKMDLELKETIYNGDKSLKQYEILDDYDSYKQLLVSEKQVYLLYSNSKKNRLYIIKIENELVNTYKLNIDSSNHITSAFINNGHLYAIIKKISDNKLIEKSIYLFEDLKLNKKILISKLPSVNVSKIIPYNNQFYMLAKDEIRNDSILKFYFSIYILSSQENILLKRYDNDSSDFMFWNYYQEGRNIYFMNFKGTLRKFDLETYNDSLLCELNEELTVSVPFFIKDTELYYTKGGLIQNTINLNDNTKKQFNLDEKKECPYYITDYLVLQQKNEVYYLCALWDDKKECKDNVLKCFKIKK